MLKKWMTLLLVATMMLAGSVIAVSAQNDALYEYEVLEDGTARITAYRETFNDQIKSLCVPSQIDGYTVTEIGECAFLRAFYLRTVVLPDSVKVIGRSAFQESGVTQIFLPAGLEEIGENAFYWCALEKLVVPSTVTTFGEMAIGFTCLPAYDQDGHRIVPGAPGLDEDFVMYTQNNSAATAYATENGVACRSLEEMRTGDINLDGQMNTTDARTALAWFLAGFEGAWCTGDLNGDGVMTTADVRLMIVAQIQ